MSGCLRQTFNLTKKFLIYNKSYSLHYYSGLSSSHGRISSKNYIYLKIIKPNLVSKRSFSLQSILTIYDSISSSAANQLVKKILVEAHEFTGISWTLTIIAASIVLKLFITLPCAIYQKFLMSKIELTHIKLSDMLKSVKEEIYKKGYKGKWTEKKMRSQFNFEVSKLKKILYVKNNCHPFKVVILFFAQFPFWLLLSFSIKALAVDAHKGHSDYPAAILQFQVGGPFWCKNLSLPDPTLILPTINSLALLICTELSFLHEIQEKITLNKAKSLLKKILKNFYRLVAVAFFFISAVSPSGLSLFWMANTLLGLAQNLLIMSPKVKRFCKIPKTPSEFDKPFSQAWNTFTQKFQMFSSRK